MSKKDIDTLLEAVCERTKTMSDEEIEKEFDEALKDVRARAMELNITQEDIDSEIRIMRQIHQTEEELDEFERKYGMTTDEFFKKYMAGETDDHMDFIEWASLAQILINLQKET